MSLKQSALHDRHVALGAKFSEFGGWEMPLEYSGVVKEHTAVRTGVGIFDVSHLGKIVVRGDGARAFVDSCFTNDLGRIDVGQAQYTLCCDESGGVVDDLIVYLKADDDVLLVPNASNSAEVLRRMQAVAPANLTLTDHHESHVVLAVQGTRSDEVLAAVGFPTGPDAAPLDYMAFAEAPYAGADVTVCRTGYTGERGYELIAPVEVAGELWDALFRAGAAYELVPCGLGARDTLRTEMGYPLHGQDMSLTISPLQARSAWAIGWKKDAFWGKEALEAERAAGPAVTLRGLVAGGRGIARPHMTVQLGGGLPDGEVTSGTFSPTLKKGVALALLDASVADGAEVTVDVRGRSEIFVVTKPPFVTPGVREA
ncbi:MAG: glycine cleavage system protein [Marmoricola sp.]|nr:glycine cleavage system protein [Marmoricola sp.]